MRTLLLLIAICPLACRPSSSTPARPAREPISFPLANFKLTERSGKTIQKSDLTGKVWIASFIFTRCNGPCPQVTGSMKNLQNALAGEKEVRLVTFTVDPANDDPAELQNYAQRFNADSERWLFLTGTEKAIHDLLNKSFKVGASRNEGGKPGDAFTHSSHLAVVDKQGNVRGYFQGIGEPAELDLAMKQLQELVHKLQAE